MFSQIEPEKYIKSTIIIDSNRVVIEEDGKQTAMLESDEGWYFFDEIFYDGLNEVISLVESKPFDDYSWDYKSLIWDFQKEQKYDLLEGNSGEGENYHTAVFLNYNPDKKIGLVKHYGWEWIWVSKYNDGRDEEIAGTEDYDVVNVLALLNENETLLEAYLLGGNPSYYIYEWDKRKLSAVEAVSLIEYNPLILKTTGTNIKYLYSSPFLDDVEYENIIWSPDGNYFVYTAVNNGLKDLYFYDPAGSKEVKLAEGHSGYSVIWK